MLRTDWLIYLKYFWIFLTLSFVVWQIVKYYKLKIKLIQTSKTEEKTAFAEKIVRTYIGKKRKIYFLRNPCIKTPFTIGILNHYIVLPELEFNKQEMEMIYIHEAIHIKNRDIFYKIVCLGILSIHCFNPLAWLLLYEYGKIIERNCDEIVIQKFFKKEERKIYARLLINLAADKSEIPVIFKDNLSRGKNKC